MIKGKGKFNLPKEAKLNRFFQILSPYWFSKIFLHATRGAIYIKFVKPSYKDDGIQ
jgi:hypothetical protein